MPIQKKNIFLTHFNLLIALFYIHFSFFCNATSSVYSFELYLHNEYYSQPPGFPNKITIVPNISVINRTTRNGKEHRLFTNILEAIRLTYKHLWIELFTSIGTEQLTFTSKDISYKKSRTGFDDFLIDMGYNFLFDDDGKVQFMPHIIVGIPTFWNITLAEQEDPLMGTRTYALGGSLEVVYDFERSVKYDIFFGLIFRCIHRFDRKYFPVLPENSFFSPGNFIDSLVLFHYRWFQHNIECGYNTTYLSDRAIKYPLSTCYQPSEILHTLYGYYAIFIEELSMLFEFGLIATANTNIKAITPYAVCGFYF